MITYERRCPLQAGAPQVFSWHKRPGAFGRLTPPWPKLVLLKQSGTIHNDDSLVFGIQIGPFMLQWHTNHSNYAENVLFVDTQTKGPFKSWKHEHHFIPRGSNHSEIVDKVICSLPFSFLSEPVLGPFLKRRLDLLFHHRHKQLQSDMGRHQAYTTQPKLKVAITGTNGLVGGALFDFLSTGGHSVYKLLRNPTQTDTNSIFWDPSEGIIESDRLENLDAIIHLGGHNIAAGRWTPAEKEKIRTSRIQSTQLLADTIHILKSPPKIFMVASAIGYYGSNPQQCCEEDAPGGDDFLANLCQDWEKTSQKAGTEKTRVINPRFGTLLSPKGGMLKRMLLPFLSGVAGKIGTGQQTMSWVSLDDTIGALHYILQEQDLDGAINIVAPSPVSNKEFTKTLGRILKRPTTLPLPKIVVKTLFGEMGEKLLLSSIHAAPTKLLDHGFHFQHNQIEEALRTELGRYS